MPVQFSRGCPFNCEFCDIIVMNGRVPRTKPPAQLIAELEALRARGLEGNGLHRGRQFHRRQTAHAGAAAGNGGVAAAHGAENGISDRSLGEPGGRPGIVRLDGGSRFHQGVCRHRNAVGRRRWKNAASCRIAGAIWSQRCASCSNAGWKSWADSSSASTATRPTFSSASSSSSSAPAWSRRWSGCSPPCRKPASTTASRREGRLEAETSGNNTDAALNFKPRLNREFLQSGYRDLMKKLYEPKVYYQRVRTFLKTTRPPPPSAAAFARGFHGLHQIVVAAGSLVSRAAWPTGGFSWGRCCAGRVNSAAPSSSPFSAITSAVSRRSVSGFCLETGPPVANHFVRTEPRISQRGQPQPKNLKMSEKSSQKYNTPPPPVQSEAGHVHFSDSMFLTFSSVEKEGLKVD